MAQADCHLPERYAALECLDVAGWTPAYLTDSGPNEPQVLGSENREGDFSDTVELVVYPSLWTFQSLANQPVCRI